MKIVHVVETWIGGIASYVTALMIEQRNRGHEVVLFCDPRYVDRKSLQGSGIGIVEYRSSRNPLRLAFIARKLRALIGGQAADVVHCHSTFAGAYVRLSRFDGPKILYTPHAWSFMKRDVSRVTAHLFAMFERWLARRCALILCMSFDELRAARMYGISPRKIELLYTGIPVGDTSERINAQPKASSTTPHPIEVGYFGRLDYQKGFDILLAALPALRETVHVHVFGAVVRGGITQPSETSQVTYHGWLSPENSRRAMDRMDVIVVPSRWEGLALVPIEAMRAAKMLVVSSESSLPEQVIHGYNGLILRQLTGACLAEQLNSLSIDDCRRMGANSRQVFENVFNAEKFFDSLMSYYEEA